MQVQMDIVGRKTSADSVFDYLRDEIVSNALPPGTKISEAEIAGRFGISRQPVRDAFSRLANQDLLLIQPQKPTVVRKFSLEKIRQARFVRLAVELEVVRCACLKRDEECAERLQANLRDQRKAVKETNVSGFHALDYEFHKLVCELSGNGIMFETIQFYKSKIDRLCMLSLNEASEASDLLKDHEAMADAMFTGRITAAEEIVRSHLSRLDGFIRTIQDEQSEFFED